MVDKLDRYQRHSLIDWFSQEAVSAARVCIVGCGAVGNEVAKNLALLGVGNLDLFDFDTIEVHNLTRSVLFRDHDIGRNKVDVAKERIEELDSNASVTAYHGDFWDFITFEKLKSYTCVICCVDNFEARIRLNKLCKLAKVGFINTGIDSKYCQVEIYPFNNAKDEACLECNLPFSVYDKLQQRYSCGWLKKVAYLEKKIPTTILTSSLTGGLAASYAMNFIKGDILESSQRILIDSFNGRSTISQFDKQITCPCCSSINESIHIIPTSPSLISFKDDLFSQFDGVVYTSEPILLSAECTSCDFEKDDVIFSLASDFDSSLSKCEKCETYSMDINIKDGFTLSELVNIYSDKSFPCKFIQYEVGGDTVILEVGVK